MKTNLALAALSVLVLASCSEEVPSTPEALDVVVSATPQAGTAPLTVQLSCGADNAEAPLTYAWLLGDGDTSTEANPTVTYTAGGSFAAVCQLVDARGLGGGGSVTITVDAAFAVTASADVIRGELPLAVSFGATPEGAEPFTFSWDFDGDDVEDSAEQDPSFTFLRSGVYSVKVTAADGSGATAQDVIEIDVLAPPPEVTATADNELGEPPLEVNFSATATGEEPFTFSWDFDTDGTEDSTAQSAAFTYTESGAYTAVVTAADANGTTAKDLVQIVVNSGPVAAPVPDRCVRTGVLVTLDGSASTDLENDELVYEWTLLSAPDGSAVTELVLPDDPEPSPYASLTPDVDGEYAVQLTVDDGWFSDTQTGTLTAADDVRVQTSDDSLRVGLTGTDIDPPLAVQVVNVCADDPLYEGVLAEVTVAWTGDNATPATYESVTDADGWAVYDGGEYGEPGEGDVSAEALEQRLRFDLEVECGRSADCATTTGGRCGGGECELATCSDGLLNQDEANVDCGGHACGATCANGQSCYPYFDGECASFNCSADGECVGLCDTEGWSPSAWLDLGAVGDTLAADQAPVVATDGRFTWLMLWISNRTGSRDIVYTRSTDNRRTWSEVADVSDLGYGGYDDERSAPQLATDESGGWIVVWESSNSLVGATDIASDWDILYATSADNGQSWSDTQILANNASAVSSVDRLDRAPSIATDRLGNWLVVWQSSSFVELGPDNPANLFFDLDILYAFSEDDGASWTDPRPVDKIGAREDNSYPPTEYLSVFIEDEFPTVAADDAGLWAAAWSHGPSREYFRAGWNLDVVVSTTDDPASGWSAPERLSPDPVPGQPRWSIDPRLATDGSHWALVWSTNTTGSETCDTVYGYDIMLATGEVDGDSIVWGEAASVEHFDLSCALPTRPRPAIATDSAGTWVVTWTKQDNIYYAVSEDFGESWSDSDVVYDGYASNSAPSLAGSESGRWMIAWDSTNSLFGFYDDPEQLIDIGSDRDIVTSFLCENDFLTPE